MQLRLRDATPIPILPRGSTKDANVFVSPPIESVHAQFDSKKAIQVRMMRPFLMYVVLIVEYFHIHSNKPMIKWLLQVEVL